MRIALVHDYLREYGGAERVVEAMHEIWPDAPLYTSFVDWNSLGIHADRFRSWDIRTSWVQWNPVMRKWHSPFRFLAPTVWSSWDFRKFDVVLSSSSWFMCRGVVRTRKRDQQTVFIDYIHTPPRNMYGYATGNLAEKHGVVKAYAAVVNFALRQYDFDISNQVDCFIANSQETRRRVRKFYRRDATVIYPPIRIHDRSGFSKTNPEPISRSADRPPVHHGTWPNSETGPGSFFLSVGRLMYAKRVDLAIQACRDLGVPLKVVGTGNDEAYLRRLAGPTVEFLGPVTDSELNGLYHQARALIFSALDEEFGIVPVEAMSRGVPVIALAQGGVPETVLDRKTGILFREPTVSALTDAVRKFLHLSANQAHSMRRACVRQAERFSTSNFRRSLTTQVADCLRAGRVVREQQ